MRCWSSAGSFCTNAPEWRWSRCSPGSWTTIWTELAHHYNRSDNLTKAVEYLGRAGQQALQRSAYTDAISGLSAGIDLLQKLPDSPECIQREVRLQLALGPAFMAVRGFAAPEVERAYTRARELCERLGDPPELFAAVHGLCLMHLVRGVLPRAHELAEQLLQRAQGAHDPALLLCAEVALGDTMFWMGEFRAAREHMEMAAKVYDPERDRPLIFRYFGVDAGVLCQGFTAHSLWNLGYPDQALKRVNEAIAMAQRLSHPLSLAYARNFAVILQQLGREARAGQESAEGVMALCAEHGFTEILAYATVMRGLEMAQQGRNEEGIAQIQAGLAASRATGAELTRPSFLCVLAEACMERGCVDEGLSALTEALAAADQHENRYYEAEMHRLQGELLLRRKDSNAAEAQSCFQRAIAIARRQSAKSFELRAATSLARLLRDTDRRDEARTMLAEIYGWFTEGFDTADLKEAKALLEELNS